jgi:hypothetical protein
MAEIGEKNDDIIIQIFLAQKPIFAQGDLKFPNCSA